MPWWWAKLIEFCAAEIEGCEAKRPEMLTQRQGGCHMEVLENSKQLFNALVVELVDTLS